MLFEAIHFHGWQKLPVGQLRQTIFITIYTGELFYIAVPWRQVFVANRPVNTMPVFGIGFKINIAPPVTLTAPHQRTAANMVSTYPPEFLYLVVWVFDIVDKELFRHLV